MFEAEQESEPHSVEYEKHKKRREQRKKQKMQLLEVNYMTDMLSRSSELKEVEESITLFEASPSPPKVKNTRRRLRLKKNPINGETGVETLLESTSGRDIELVNEPKTKLRVKVRKSRTKNNSSAEVDGEIVISHNDVSVPTVDEEMSSLTLDIQKLMLESVTTTNCHGNSPSKTETPNKNQKMKISLTGDVTVNRIKSLDIQSKSSGDIKAMPSSSFYHERKKKRQSNPSKETPTKDDSKKTPSKKSDQNQKPKEKFGEYIPLDEVKKGLESNELILGYIRINPKDHKLSYVNNPIKDQQDILIISIRDRNCALDGDRVVIKLKPESEWKSINQKTGYVVFILEKVHPRTTVGILKLMQDKNRRYALFHPRDSRVPRMKIPFTDWPTSFYEQAEEYEKILFLGQITKWIDPYYPLGTIIENIGIVGDLVAESQAILAEFCLDVTPYGEEMKQYFPETGDIDPKEYEYRMDLRKECIFTIDPLTARDLDDAVSCKTLSNGNYEIGVHISDVSYYLQENTPLDEIVSQKATSIYMVESVYHMLPKELCMMCSLLPGEDKLAFSVIWEMTPEGKVISHKFSRTVINSCVQLAYEHAQMMIDDPAREFAENELPEIHHGYKPEELSRIVNILHKIAVNLRNSRYQSGALRLDQPKVSFRLNMANGLPESYQLYENKECHRLIEEFMLLANITVATRLRNDYPDIAFLRSHSAPKDHMMNSLKATLEKVGIHLDVSTAGGLQQSLWKYCSDDALSKTRMLVLNLLCAKPMTRANYFCADNSNDTEDYWHYALSVPLYTHFTSPIRRFADIIVHRQLAGSLGYRDKPTWSNEYVISAAANCNKQKYNAKRAGEQSIEMYLVHYIDEHQPMIEKAVVMDVRQSSFDAIVISNGLTVRVYLNNLDEGVSYKFLEEEEDEDESNDLNDEGKKLLNLLIQWPAQDNKPSDTQIIAMFSIVTISLTKKDKVLKLNSKLVRSEV